MVGHRDVEADLVDHHGDHEVLACDGVRDEGQRLGLWVGLPKVGDVHPVELGTRGNDVVLAEDPHADQHVAKVLPRGRFRRRRLLDLCLGHEVALQEHLLEPEAGTPVELWRGSLARRSILRGWHRLLAGLAVLAIASLTEDHDAALGSS